MTRVQDAIAAWWQVATGPALDVRAWQQALAAADVNVFAFEHDVDGLVVLTLLPRAANRRINVMRWYPYHNSDDRTCGWRVRARCGCGCGHEIVNLGLFHGDQPASFLATLIARAAAAPPRSSRCTEAHRPRGVVRAMFMGGDR